MTFDLCWCINVCTMLLSCKHMASTCILMYLHAPPRLCLHHIHTAYVVGLYCTLIVAFTISQCEAPVPGISTQGTSIWYPVLTSCGVLPNIVSLLHVIWLFTQQRSLLLLSSCYVLYKILLYFFMFVCNIMFICMVVWFVGLYDCYFVM